MLGSVRVTSQAGAPTLIALPLHFEAMLAKACLMECLRCSHRPETPVLCLQCGALLCGGQLRGLLTFPLILCSHCA
jgi:hypothetical protein